MEEARKCFTLHVLLHHLPPSLSPPSPPPPRPPQKGTNRKNRRQTLSSRLQDLQVTVQREKKKFFFKSLTSAAFRFARTKGRGQRPRPEPGKAARPVLRPAGREAQDEGFAPGAEPGAGKESGKAPGTRGRRLISCSRAAAPDDSPPLARPGSHRGGGIGWRASGPRGETRRPNLSNGEPQNPFRPGPGPGPGQLIDPPFPYPHGSGRKTSRVAAPQLFIT